MNRRCNVQYLDLEMRNRNIRCPFCNIRLCMPNIGIVPGAAKSGMTSHESTCPGEQSPICILSDRARASWRDCTWNDQATSCKRATVRAANGTCRMSRDRQVRGSKMETKVRGQ
ncbi:unnamed protein product [Mycena citricolor]|uniref:Uncharacterized protein n=1 Tax=Mycena citricolor TaxID=2018698 RepID=A0AAD2K7D3_9AGAR|nr:unnamed protein product [Mycena citricolor]CAK5282792.1 unnamed protein product [Mycena citricolor]